MPGWQDDPVVAPGGWQADPVVGAKPKSASAGQPVRAEAPPFWARVGRGAQDTIDRVVQLGIGAGEKMGLEGYPEGLSDIATQQMNAESADYARRRAENGKEGLDPARMLGNAMMQSPLMLVPGGKTAWARAGSGATTGGLSGALQFDPTNSLKQGVMNAGLGAGVGAVVAPAMGAITDRLPAAWNWAAGRIKGAVETMKGEASERAVLAAVPDLAQVQQTSPQGFRDLIAEAQEMVKKTGQVDADALSRKANLIANGLTPTKSMVTRNPADWSLERNLQKMAQSPDDALSRVGNELTGVYQANDRALTQRMGSLSGGLPAGEMEAQGNTVMKALDSLSTASQKRVSAIYEQVRKTQGDQLASDARNLYSTLDDLRDNTYAEKLVSSVTNKLKRFGMLDKDGSLTNQTLTVTQAEELRKFVNTLPNDFGRRDIIKAIDADVLAGAGQDAFAGARGAAAQRFGMLGNAATQKALNAYGELTQGKTAQGFISSQVINGATQDVDDLLKTLRQLPQAESDKAIDAIRAGVMSHLEEKAVVGPAGGQRFSGAGLDKALKNIGEEKLNLVFGAEKAGQLRSLARAAVDATYEPPFSSVNHSNTGAFLTSLGQTARYAQATPLLSHSIEVAKKVAAQNSASNQLAEALAARAPGVPAGGQLPPSLQQLAAALSTGVSPLINAGLNQRRQQPEAN